MTQDAFPAQQQAHPGWTDEMDPVPDHGESSYRGNNKLVGKNTLITGGDSGIGRATAIAFAREGANVAFTYLPAESGDADSTMVLLEHEQNERLAIEADLRESHGCSDVVRRTVEEFGSLDILINNAGYQMAREGGIENMSDDRIDRTIRTNLMALLWMVRAAVPHLTGGGAIINNSSIQAFEPSTSLLDYAATKSAINNLTVNLAAELGPQDIRVNAVAPGPIWTPLQPATQPEAKITEFGSDTPLGRAGQPAEVAPAFVFLANDYDAGYISGTVLGVTGGKPVF